MTEKPTLQIADTDGDGPVKRRRRPALSCVECRVRKVKCDRAKPCTPCTRVRAGTCTYRPFRQGIRLQDSGTPDVPVHPAERLPSSVSPASGAGPSATINDLTQRIKTLERELAVTRLGNQNPNDTSESLKTSAGQFLKSKFYGNSHWMNAMEPYDALSSTDTTINTGTNRKEVDQSSELYISVSGIKRMARIIKTSRMLQPSLLPEVIECIPSRKVCDQLVDGYLRNFEGMFRVLHVPSFRQEYEAYWNSNAPAKPFMTIKILLVCAIGVPFCTSTSQAKLRGPAAKWIQAAADWQNGPHLKSRLNMAGLQIQILTILARQVCAVDGDHVWISAGSLLRTAMTLGLHRDPSNFNKISRFHAEMRRRLWATVLEITVQCSLDMGVPPMISPEDYDTETPANVNDVDIEEGNNNSHMVQLTTNFTDTSVQIASLRTLSIRLEIVRLINKLQFELSYNDVLRLSSELTTTSREQITFLKGALAAGHTITTFQIKLLDSLTRRFILCLHRPFFAKALEDPQYYYSRKICLENSLAIFAPATSLQPDEEDDWTRLSSTCVGFFKSILLYALSTVYFELQAQIKEHQEDESIFTPLKNKSSTTNSRTTPSHLQALLNALQSAHKTAISRLRNGETNAKGAVFLGCALARIDALLSGNDPDLAVLEAAREAIVQTTQILKDVYKEEHGMDIDLNPKSGPFAGKSHTRGEGADDVTGKYLRTGTGAGDGDELSVENMMLDRGLGEPNALRALDEWNAGVDTDFDVNAYFMGESMNKDFDYHFGRSPDWFYDLSGWAGGDEFGPGFDGL
ncbi:hypothetical protein T440DRAFT_465056 [Plenodomus tracheiphilus IPT5]|uniref:Zn(2)-C6 fungal-type domain-containing protein n=1 Tax=Plenodomus tracheiphilus IPT5 TaxID=1408161 RepID=A0A6A7BFA3_9PLEO|nr:hypothetical protein T440DRAFT_465056 [Plenodomus tracheiphilus IPT5]